MHRSILLVDDDRATLLFMRRFFEDKGWRVYQTGSGQEAISIYETNRPPVVILDLHLPFLSGMDLLEILRERDPDSAVIMLTGDTRVEPAVEAMRKGAEGFLTKPIDLGHLEAAVERAYEKAQLRQSNRVMAARQADPPQVVEALEESPVMRELQKQIQRLAESDVTVLLQGETGTGKSWVAGAIHRRSPRAQAPYIEVNCARLSHENLERELFGEERMATRGRRVQARGQFELANNGTLFLDEIGVLAPELQPRLLEVLETRRFRRVGGVDPLEVDVRVIAATNRDLEEDVREGRFREDLYYRLAVVPVRLSPLRERTRADLIHTAEAMLRDLQRRIGRREEIRLTPEAADALALHSWPGNLREMRNLLERILILHPDLDALEPEHLPQEMSGGRREEQPRLRYDPTLPLDDVERAHIVAALKYFNGNRSKAAESLRIGRRTLYDRLERYGLAHDV